jgi:hypothetical protein
VANTFDEQARDRFTKSLKFMEKAVVLLEDDLIYRSALADAVSAIKNMLQGYLLLRVAATPASDITQRWQEIAASNRMPELLAACGEAGLDLRGLAVEIRRLNTDRNDRAHDDPQLRIEADQAALAVETARNLQRRIRAAIQGRPEARSLPQMAAQAAHVMRAAASGQLRAGVASAPVRSSAAKTASSTRTAPDETPALASAAPAAAPTAPTEKPAAVTGANGVSAAVAERPPAADELPAGEVPSALAALDDAGDTSGELPIVTSRRRRGRRASALLQVLIAVVLLLIGVLAGIGITVPVTTGHAPGWLSFATRLLPTPAATSPTATSTVATAPSPQVTTQPQAVGSLTIGAPSCASGRAIFTLANTGATSTNWSVGSPDATGASFAIAAGAMGTPSLAGTLAPGASITLFAANPASPSATGAYHIVVVAADGTAQVIAPTCHNQP